MTTAAASAESPAPDPSGTGSAAAVGAAPAKPYRIPIRARLGGPIFILPGVVWLAIFFLLPLVIILVVSLASTDFNGHVFFDHLDLHNYETAFRPEYLAAFSNSLRYSLITTILSDMARASSWSCVT